MTLKKQSLTCIFFLILFPNHEFLPSMGTFTSYNIGCCVLQPDAYAPKEGKLPLRGPSPGSVPSVGFASEDYLAGFHPVG